jgi:hypothetical protein
MPIENSRVFMTSEENWNGKFRPFFRGVTKFLSKISTLFTNFNTRYKKYAKKHVSWKSEEGRPYFFLDVNEITITQVLWTLSIL